MADEQAAAEFCSGCIKSGKHLKHAGQCALGSGVGKCSRTEVSPVQSLPRNGRRQVRVFLHTLRRRFLNAGRMSQKTEVLQTVPGVDIPLGPSVSLGGERWTPLCSV